MPRHFCALVILTLALLVQPAEAAAQGARRELLSGSRVWVDGTSNKSDWSVKASALSGFVVLQLKQDQLEVSGGSFTVPARQLVSEHGVIMDRLMHGALKSDDHPEIVYELVRATITPGADRTYAVATEGRLTIAGVTREITQTVQAHRLPDGTIRFTGSQPVLMNEHGMTPPTAMFGTLRTANRVVVHFDLLVKP